MPTNNKNFKVKKGLVTGSDVNTSSVVFSDYTKGFVLTSPSGYKYRIGIETDGSLSTGNALFDMEYLVIAGGGGGGRYDSSHVGGGGGGAGGYRSSVTGENSGGGASAEGVPVLIEGVTYTVTVGAGGAAGQSWETRGASGGSSTFNGVTSTGGGGGSSNSTTGGSGGSGGGSGSYYLQVVTAGSGTTNQGYSGGNNGNTSGVYPSGGGGGAGQVGANGSGSTSGNGGAGVASSVTGSSVTRGGGGGGGNWVNSGTAGTGGTGGGGNGSNSGAGTSGSVNTGGGGGNSAVGGSGVVILKYPNIFTATFSAGVTQTTSTSGGFKVSTITATSTTSETVTFSVSPVMDSLVLFLDAGDSSSYPGTGTTWTDLTNNGNDGTLINGVGYGSNNYGILTFDGSDDYVQTSLLHNESPGDFSMSCWMKTSTTQLAGLMGFRTSFSPTNNLQRQMYITGDSDAGTSGNFLSYDEWTWDGSATNPSRKMFINSTSITTGNWINIVATSNSTKSIIYYNGVQIQEVISTQPTERLAAPLIIGRASNWTSSNPNALLNGYAFNGNISNVMVYNKALTEIEVRQNFNAFKSRFGL